MSRRYYTLLERLPSCRWAIAFGDFDRECVQQELEDMRDSSCTDDETEYKIICTAESQAAIDAKVEALNAAL